MEIGAIGAVSSRLKKSSLVTIADVGKMMRDPDVTRSILDAENGVDLRNHWHFDGRARPKLGKEIQAQARRCADTVWSTIHSAAGRP